MAKIEGNNQAISENRLDLAATTVKVQKPGIDSEMLRTIAQGMQDIRNYDHAVGWKFGGNKGPGSQETIKEYALFVLEVSEREGLMTSEKATALARLVEQDPDTSVARSLTTNPTIFNECSVETLSAIGDHVSLPMQRPMRYTGESRPLADYTRVNTEFNNGFSQAIEVFGAKMALKMHVSCENGSAKFDFVPISSLGATHAFEARLYTDLTDRDKQQAKLDITNALIALAQSSELPTQTGQLIIRPHWADDPATFTYEEIARIDTLTSNKTNERFANYLHHKFGFDVTSDLYGYTASITTEKLKDSLPALLAIRQNYLDRA